MKENMGVCPGCRKGCSADAPRCKYGKMYFAQQEIGTGCRTEERAETCESPYGHCSKRKWEKRVERHGLAWRFLMIGRGMKKMLMEGAIAEEELFDTLSNSEKQVLAAALEKLGRRIYCR